MHVNLTFLELFSFFLLQYIVTRYLLVSYCAQSLIRNRKYLLLGILSKVIHCWQWWISLFLCNSYQTYLGWDSQQDPSSLKLLRMILIYQVSIVESFDNVINCYRLFSRLVQTYRKPPHSHFTLLMWFTVFTVIKEFLLVLS